MLSDRCLSVLSCPVFSCMSVCNVGALCPNSLMDQDKTWHSGRPQPWTHCVRRGPSSSQKGHNPQFLAHVCCGQTAGWIKMSLGMEVGLGPCDIVLDGDPAPPKNGHSSPHFSAHILWPNGGWIKLPLGLEVGLGPGDILLDVDPSPPKKGAQQPPSFQPMYCR